MSGSLSSFGRIATLALAAASTGLFAVPLCAASGPGCVRVAVPEPVELPDGTIHPAGNLSLCIGQALSPVTALQRVSVGGMPVGILLSRRGTSEGKATAEPSVLFRRLAGRLHLVGYAAPAGATNQTYLLRDPGAGARRPRFDVSIAPAVAERAVEVLAPLLVARVN